MSTVNIYLDWNDGPTKDFLLAAINAVAIDANIIECDSNSLSAAVTGDPEICEVIVSGNAVAGNFVPSNGQYIPVVYVYSDFNPIRIAPHTGGQASKCSISDPDGLRQSIQEAIGSSKLFYKLKSNQIKLSDLNTRERSVVMMAAEGVPNKTIARRLNVSVKTIEHCRRKAYTKLNVTCSAEVASLVTFDRFCSVFGAMPPVSATI